jgi:hypothetical protein
MARTLWFRSALIAVVVVFTAALTASFVLKRAIGFFGGGPRKVLAVADCTGAGPWRSLKAIQAIEPARSGSSHGFGRHRIPAMVVQYLAIDVIEGDRDTASTGLARSSSEDSGWRLLALTRRSYLLRCDGRTAGVSIDGGETWREFEAGADGWPRALDRANNTPPESPAESRGR